jgi:hypothetical protein
MIGEYAVQSAHNSLRSIHHCQSYLTASAAITESLPKEQPSFPRYRTPGEKPGDHKKPEGALRRQVRTVPRRKYLY